MPDPVDLSNLREMTDGDKELESELFSEFISSAKECIAIMNKNCSDGGNEAWKSTAHALKGISLSLGAQHLAELCKVAQESVSSAEKKQDLLGGIESEYSRVEKYLRLNTP